MHDDHPQLVTERLGGGVSARLVAVASVGLLMGVVWLGASGRTALPASTPQPAAAIGLPVAATATPAPSDSTAATPRPERTPIVRGEVPADTIPLVSRRFGPLGEDAFAITFWLEGRFYLNVLREQESGRLKAVTRVPLYAEMGDTSMQIIQLWTRDDRPPLAEIADFEVPLGELVTGPTAVTLLEVVREARPRRQQAPRLVRRGYALTVGTDVRQDHAYLLFDLTIGGAPSAESATDRFARITEGWTDLGQRLPGRAPYDNAVIRQQGGPPPLILLVAQAGTPRGTMVLGHSWVAGY